MRDWLRSWWILLTLPFGFLGWLAFVYAGMRAKNLRWVGYAVAYFAPVVAFFSSPDESKLEDYMIAVVLIAWPISFIHTLVIRREYLDRRDLIDDPNLRQARLAALRREFAGTVARSSPELALESGIGRLEQGFDEAGLVDVNHASVRELERLPGVDRETAKRIAFARKEIGGFSSANELGHLLDLPAPVVDALRPRALFLGSRR
jgi:hypothetical protein